jgi:cytidylate kinase
MHPAMNPSQAPDALTAEIREILRSFIVTLDGESGSGKSTTAHALAEKLGLTYLDTGAMYRAVTLAALRGNVPLENGDALGALARDLRLEFHDDGKTLLVDGEDVSRDIRSAAVSRSVSTVSAHPQVRRAMVRLQRLLGERGGIVVEGRDLGTVVYPHAHAKFFLRADLKVRAERRRRQLGEQGHREDLASIQANLEERDRLDSSRRTSPLVRAPGAAIVDTGTMTFEEQVEGVAERVVERAGALADLRMKGDPPRWWGGCKPHYRVAVFVLRILFRILYGVRVYGSERAAFRTPFIFAANHLAYVDPPLLGSFLPREVHYMAKMELFRFPLFSRLIRAFNAIPLRRGLLDREALDRAERCLGSGGSLLIFPEGTRFPPERMGPPKAGVGLLSLRTRTPVIPVHVRGTRGLGRSLLRLQRAEIRLGDPIWVDHAGPDGELLRDSRLLARMVMHTLEYLQEEPPRGDGG